MTPHGYVALPSSAEHVSPTTLQTPHGGHLTVHPHPDSTSTPAYTYAYGPGGVRGLLANRYTLGCAVFASIGGLSFGYDQGVIANVLVMKDFLARWPVGPWEKGLMTAVLELGALFGALSAGVLADSYSRRHSIFLASIVFCIGSGLQCGARSLNDLILGRAIGGFGVGALSMLSPLYMAEISPPELRGSLMALEQLAIVFGVVCGFWTGFLTRALPSSTSWRLPLALQLGPGLALAAGTFLLPPSPRFLVLRGRLEEAGGSLRRLRGREGVAVGEGEGDPLIRLELLEMRVNVGLVRGAGKDAGGGWGGGWKGLFGRKYVRRTFIGVMVMFFQQWSGINALLYYGPTLVKNIGIGLRGDTASLLSDRDTAALLGSGGAAPLVAGGGGGDTASLLVAGGIGVVQFVAVIPAVVGLDRWGRRPLLRGGSAIMALSHFLIALLILQFEDDWPSHWVAAWTAVTCIYTFTAAYGTSFGPIGWVLPSEVFPLSMRSRGVALATASNWVNNFLIGLVTPALMEISAAATFLVFSCACSAAYLWSTHLVPETAGVSLEEMDAVFGSEAGREDGRRKRELEQEYGLQELIAEVVGG
ncbi:general substrate transporter [Leucogyrophana mollusca]|uniref:General substrate transporter n=1 Tax=Leucogyrophana mollusca TaxID=85980 RepID=A0ACB8B785_9AGAM|nr:general substrate transporter [Leucogyrophana mollusca]